MRQPRWRDCKWAELLCVNGGLPALAPIDARRWLCLDLRVGAGGEHGTHKVDNACVSEHCHELIVQLLDALGTDGEQRRDNRIAVRARAHAYREPPLGRPVRGGALSAGAHAPNASFIFAQKPFPRESSGTLFCTSLSRSMSTRSSSASRSGVQS